MGLNLTRSKRQPQISFPCPVLHPFLATRNHGMLWVWRDLTEHLIPALLPWTVNHYPVKWHSRGWAAGWTLSHRGIRKEHTDIPVGNKTTSDGDADGDPWKDGVTQGQVHLQFRLQLWDFGKMEYQLSTPQSGCRCCPHQSWCWSGVSNWRRGGF